MKRNALVFLSALLLLSVSSIAFAAGPDPLVLDGDCEGWSVSGYMYFSGSTQVDINLTVDLYLDGVLVHSNNVTDVMYPTDDPNFLYEGDWGEELCGDYTIALTMWWTGIYGPGVKRREAQFTCDCVPDFCTYTPGYWKNHPDAWPVEGLTVGCVDYTKAELMEIFDWPTEGNISIKLFHHLVAAKLNVLIGADDYIMGAITDGDDFLCIHPLLNVPVGDYWDDAEEIKDELEAYNEIECEEEEEEDDDMLSISAPKVNIEKAAATEDSSWGSIKKKHQ